VELDAVAAATYATQIGDHIQVADVRRFDPSGPCDVLIAGPPCQGFSTLGKRDPLDPRNELSLEVVRCVAVCRPSVVVIENVAAFLEAPVWTVLASRLERLGYAVSTTVLDATSFGVPQRRLRSFTFASRVGLPEVLPVDGVSTLATVRQAWAGLPDQPDGSNLHYAPRPTALALARMQVIPPGGNKRDIMDRAPHLAAPSWWKLGSQVGDVWGRMLWDEPANTLRTCLQDPTKGRYLHPEQHRVISLREAARLHSIDDRWHFEGAPNRVARQIGNSVPPLLGRAVARAIADVLHA
jgi:DNA (cytosine-5)-methyltransferase 1